MTIKICFRLDDPHAMSDHKLESCIFKKCVQYNVPLCVAVIPFRQSRTGPKIAIANQQSMPHLAEGLQRGIITLAQHGCFHTRVYVNGGVPPSEFVGVNYNEQYEKIQKGRTQLRQGFDHEVSGFIPPYNTYDLSTLTAVDKIGFQFLSAGLRAPSISPRAGVYGRTVLLPMTSNLKNLLKNIELAKRFIRMHPVIIVVMHPDEFEEYQFPPDLGDPEPFTNIEQLESIFEQVRKEPNVELCSVLDLVKEVKAGQKLKHIADTWWFRHIPDRFKYKFPQSVLIMNGVLRWLFSSGIR